MAAQEYVTNDAWLRAVGRPDAVDTVADQFERPVAVGMESFWSREQQARRQRSTRGWHAMRRGRVSAV
jgi:hypothetical protein